jgi:hypothetical protein
VEAFAQAHAYKRLVDPSHLGAGEQLTSVSESGYQSNRRMAAQMAQPNSKKAITVSLYSIGSARASSARRPHLIESASGAAVSKKF